MVDVKFTYPKEEYPFKVDKASFEKVVTERVNKFFSIQKKLKEPTTLELIVSKEGEITSALPIFDKTLKELIEELKKELEKWK
jgi:hypothetical protein